MDGAPSGVDKAAGTYLPTHGIRVNGASSCGAWLT